MYVIHGIPGGYAKSSVDWLDWQWVSKESGHPWTDEKTMAREYKTHKGAVRAMEQLRKTASHWKSVGNACEVYRLEITE